MEKSGEVVNIPAGQLTKEQRTQFHETIKSSFPGMVTNTAEVDGEKVISVRKASAAPDKRNTFWKHKPWPQGRPKFLHFCMFKENLDTFVALSNLSMDLKTKSNKFAFAGTKDARAKTSQMVSIKQISAEQVHEAAKKFQKIIVGNFAYKDRELKLGDLKGNRFDLVLRHVQGNEDMIARRMASFQSVGFVNYYGMQRFGTTSSGTHEVGRAILRREWRVAVDLLLSGRESEMGSMADAHRAWRADRDPQRALSCLTGRQQRTTIEGRVLHTLSTIRATAYQEALDRLPSGTRQLYVHAYQSWVWNRLVSRRLAEHGLKLRPGDLVLAGDQSTAEESATDMEPAAELETVAEVEPTAPTSSGGPRLPEVHALTEAELDAHSIYDLVMPLPGWAVRYPENELSSWYKEMLSQDGVELTQKLCDTMPQYSLAGAYRHVLARPGDVSWRVLRYSNPNSDLLLSDVDRLRGAAEPADEPDAPFRALIMQFSLPPSSYATMAVREITGTDSSLVAQMKLNAAYSAEIQQTRNPSNKGRKAEGDAEKAEGKTSADEKQSGDQPDRGQKRSTDLEEGADEKRLKTEAV
ncbi:Pseudouridylate synthase 7 [Amphibalanus amphitrite]|uniref:Pseudouridylate synthase 7 n=1 Tax=Amphibalanus amphitrite TaxID=1232801 RepID=A0A6A4W168_AMPAM|nr:Pseudouridylate synthase 7 [Amphibalanus amphitrite]